MKSCYAKFDASCGSLVVGNQKIEKKICIRGDLYRTEWVKDKLHNVEWSGESSWQRIPILKKSEAAAITFETRERYDRRGINRLVLSNALCAGASVTSPLVPWNTCGMFMYSVLGVGALEYLPYAFYNYLTPLIFIVYFFAVGAKRFPVKANI